MLIFLLAALESEEDRRKFAEIYEQHHTRLEDAAMSILKNQTDAEDAVQNAYMQVIRHFEKISEIPCRDLPFWLISIVKNEALIILRKQKKVVLLEDWDTIPDTVADITEYAELVGLFARLPDTYRAVLEMKYLLGYSYKEISGRLGISESAANTRASRGRALLRNLIKQGGFSHDGS